MCVLLEADDVFHLAPAEAPGEGVFQLILKWIVDLLHEVRRPALAASVATARAGFYHRRILQSVKTNDAGEEARAMQEHMTQANQEILATLRRGFESH